MVQELRSLRSHAGGEKQQQLLFLFPAQRLRSRLNFLKLAHWRKLSQESNGNNHSINSLSRYMRLLGSGLRVQRQRLLNRLYRQKQFEFV